MSALTDFNDLANERGIDAVRETVEAARPIGDTGVTEGSSVRSIGENWPDPIIPGQNPVPDIPPDVLPSWVARMAGAVAESTQTPSAMAVLCALSVLATCLHRRFEVAPYGEDDDYTEPVSLWTLTGMGSGNRKTSVINSLSAPLVRWEKLERDRLRPENARNAAARLVAKKRIEKLTKDAVNAENDEERERLRKLIEEEE
ncbi:MAG: DUF3987 domain-containing protein, partial [Propionivibrio sp.]|nr:DUF3987 domain-containing protein [Propionivibrio sp.]